MRANVHERRTETDRKLNELESKLLTLVVEMLPYYSAAIAGKEKRRKQKLNRAKEESCDP